MLPRVTLVLGLVALASAVGPAGRAWAEDDDYLPRSSSPRGFQSESTLASSLPGGMSAQGSASAAAPGASRGGGDGAAASAASGAVAIQGTTNIMSSGQNIDSTSLGTRNRGCTQVGGIGGCK